MLPLSGMRIRFLWQWIIFTWGGLELITLANHLALKTYILKVHLLSWAQGLVDCCWLRLHSLKSFENQVHLFEMVLHMKSL